MRMLNAECFPANMVKMRKAKKMNQADLAKILQCSQQAYSRWERGVGNMPVCKIILLAKLYGTTLDNLFTPED